MALRPERHTAEQMPPTVIGELAGLRAPRRWYVERFHGEPDPLRERLGRESSPGDQRHLRTAEAAPPPILGGLGVERTRWRERLVARLVPGSCR